ncbi:hypothetical protein [Flavobacterium hercynium]|uniref:Uncharacterized protein n=1 Tax=Flavobacterium hercynium TaxID=387094 RepID=A0A226GQ46_9FLAO|nr:hypothetical protein [Flavobacterium hercynium]OXA84045.1 hypothetical protein B0A66_21390 [Flavobacterium hercynium]SMP37091.1 hypothetical protein SAMN06265346_12643 [Flavobacterium hercynium]
MRKLLLINITLLLVFSISSSQGKKYKLEYQNDHIIQNIGIGLVQLVNVEESIVLYTDTTFSRVKTKKAIVGSTIVPLLNKPDYVILYFICLSKNSKYYKIATDDNTFAYIKPSKNFIFYNWNKFLKDQVLGVSSKDLVKNPPRNGISGKTIDIKNWEDDDETTVVKIQGDWLQMKNITQDNKLYWIQWKNEKTLKVYLNLLM